MSSTDFSTYAALEMGLISAMHTALGNTSGAALWAQRANRTTTMIHTHLWDEQDKFYYYRDFTSQEFVRVRTLFFG